jgi:hypothetical protein
MTDTKLLPCPFCGGKGIGDTHVQTYSLDSSYDIFGCKTCGANFECGSAREWNTRATAAKDAEIEALRAEVERLKVVAHGFVDEIALKDRRAEQLAEELWDAKEKMLAQVKWVACDCGCEREKPADAVSVAWIRAATMLNRALLQEQEDGK